VKTAQILEKRVSERFPERGLALVCRELLEVAQQTQQRADWIARPNWWIRTAVFLLILFVILIAVAAPILLEVKWTEMSLVDFVQVVEASLNDVIIIGAAIFFLLSVERRMKRQRTLDALHELRSLAHVIDMHQLTKDPERILGLAKGPATSSSPKENMTAFELERYLDYCSEMLSLIGKVAALYAQDLDEPSVVTAVNEIENLTNGLSRKIWQKIMILYSMDGR
jgi:hypothetical protein